MCISLLSGSQLLLPAEARQLFYCDTKQALPTVTFKTSDGYVKFLEFETGTKTHDPTKRCQEVAARLESWKSRGRLNLTHGFVNRSPVICSTDRVGDKCDASNVLVTFTRDTNAKQQLQLFKYFPRLSAKDRTPIKLSGGGADSNDPVTMTGGNSKHPPVQMTGNGNRPDTDPYFTANDDYFNIGQLVDDWNK
jgi:Circadian oscillating protein COP23